MKIGIMGGTFDPIHMGHLMLGEYAYRNFDLDEVWFLPNGNPPHKEDPDIRKDTEDRLAMTALAIQDTPYFRLSTYETEHAEKSYSYRTMEHFRMVYPQHEFYFIIGADSLFNMETWMCLDRLLRAVVILAAYRDDADTPEEMYRQIRYLNRKYRADIRLLRTPLVPVSSHEIREQIAAGHLADLPVPERVAAYIRENHLYQGEKS